jgi:hypothetical protein
MSKPQEQRAEHFFSPAAQTTTVKHEDMMACLPDENPGILTIRPVSGHPFASLPLGEQERARHPEPPVEAETVATWANLEELAHDWGTFARDLAFITSPASAHIFQAIGMAFLALSHEESAYAHYFLLGNRLRYPPSTIAEGLEQTGVDLHEAFVDWTAVGMWLEWLANDGHPLPHLLDAVRPLVMQARAQQQRLWSLLLSVQGEHARLTQRDAAHTQEGHA